MHVEPSAPAPISRTFSEEERLATLRALGILDSAAEERFDRITRLAARLLHTPIALLSLVDEHRQWFKSSIGLGEVRETSREVSFCAHALNGTGTPLVVPDATADPRFSGNPLVTGELGVRFYAGHPVTAENGAPLGTLCVIDRQPRELSAEDRATLADLAALASDELRAQSVAAALTRVAESEARERLALAKFDSFMANTPALVFIKDSDSRMVYYNQEFAETFGVQAGQILGLRDNEWLPARIASETMAHDRVVLASGRVHQVEESAPTITGELHHWMVLKFPINQPGAEPLLGGVGIDVTDRKRAEDAVRESEARYRDLVESPHVLIQSVAPDGRFLFTSGGWRLALGYGEEEIADLTFADIVAPESASRCTEIFNRICAGEVHPQFEAIFRGKGGRPLYVEGSAAGSFDAEGHPLAVRFILRDVSRRHAAEAELNKVMSLQRTILESANAAIIALDFDGIIRLFNRGAEELLGYSAAEVEGRLRPELFHDPAEVQARAAGIAQERGELAPTDLDHALRYAAMYGPSAQEWTWVRKDGTTIPVRLSTSVLRNSSGQATGWVGIARDITPHRQAETAMRRAREAAEAANEAKSRFLANMSHEVRTPLNGIIGVNRMLLEMGLRQDQQELTQIVQESAEGLLTIVNDILDFAKIEAGHIELEAVDFDLYELIEKMRQLNAVRASTRRLVIETLVDPAVPRRVRGDPTRLRQVLSNLLGNAIKFSEDGKIVVAVSRVDAPPRRSGEVFRFSVTDSGIGISPEHQVNIFEPFTQADASTTRRFGGTGLGLSICRQLVHLMGGDIAVESREGEGSTFWFTCLLAPAAALPPAVAAAVTDDAPLRLRVLLAEDTAVNRLVAVHLLQRLGCEVDAVENGEEALAALAARPYDVVLMDCQMPVLDGYEATTRLRQREGTGRRTPVIALTANAMAGEKERCLALGMDAYLSKPFRPADLRTVLAALARCEPPPPEALATPPVLNPKAIESLRRESADPDGTDHFPSFVALFEEEASAALRAFDKAELEGDVPLLCRAAHKLRGAAANFGATGLQTLCTQVERDAYARRVTTAMGALPLLRTEIEHVRSALNEERRHPAPIQPI